MTTDAQLIESRKKEDRINYTLSCMDPDRAPKLAPALWAVEEVLRDGQWHAHQQVLAAMLRASALTVKTCEGRLYDLVAADFIERTGDWSRRRVRGEWKVTDTRQFRILDWPTADEIRLAGRDK